MTEASNSPRGRRTVLLAAEIGIGIRYFCQTGLLRELMARELDVVVVAPNPGEVSELLRAELPAVSVEPMRLAQLDHAFAAKSWAWVRSLIYVSANHLRITGMSRRMNLAVPRDYRTIMERQWRSKRSRQRYLIPFLRSTAAVLKRSRIARRTFEWMLAQRPLDNFHADTFERYTPTVVVTSSPGWWPGEEMILREANSRGIATLGVVAGWDHPCSKGLPGMRPDRVAAWSEIHRQELVLGSDFREKDVVISGPVHFDVYRRPNAASSREAYFERHKLDPDRRLITFGCSFVGLSPNFVIVEALAAAVASGALGVPAQLLIRLHPSHLKKAVGKYREVRQEGEKYYELSEKFPHIRIDAPLLGNQGIPNYTSPADAQSLASLFAHTDVFVTLFSTMVLEACFNDVPVVAAALDPPSSDLEDFIPISATLDWPTHSRIIASGAASVARDPDTLVAAVRRYIDNRQLHARERKAFAEQECTYTDGRCASRLAAIIEGLAKAETGSARHRSLTKSFERARSPSEPPLVRR